MDYKYYSSRRKKEKDQSSSNDVAIVPKMILKHSKEIDHPTVEQTNHSSTIRLLSPHPNQSSNQKNYEQSYFNQLLGIDVKEKLPDIFNLIDSETWSFKDNFLIKFLNGDQSITGPPSYSKIGIVGKQCVGKSHLMNKLAGKNVFKTHQTSGNEFMLKHLTEGIDIHITDERVFLLDSQPLMSASILDEQIKSTHVNNHVPQEIVEPEKYIHITSLQILSFLIVNCDYLIIVNDWLMDLHFLKLISTALMLVGDVNPKADLVFYFKKRFTSLSNSQFIQTLQSIFGKSIIVYEDDENEDDDRFVTNMFKLCAKKRLLYSTLSNTINVSERNWLMNAKKYWEVITSKSSLQIEYSRFIF